MMTRKEYQKLNNAINIFKELCNRFEDCQICPMNENCYYSPNTWNEISEDYIDDRSNKTDAVKEE